MTGFFGKEGIEAAAMGLKDLPEAMELRNRVLSCFAVLAAWAWEHVRYDRPVRLIIRARERR